MKLTKKFTSIAMICVLATSLIACSGGNNSKDNSKVSTNDKNKTNSNTSGDNKTEGDTQDNDTSSDELRIDNIKIGEDYTDLEASIKILTNRTDIVDSVYKGYAEEFKKIYPNIDITYEGVTDYEQSLILRLSTGDWGDICFIPTSVDKTELPNYFISYGDTQTLNQIYRFCDEMTYQGQQYGLANGGTANGVAYNKKIWEGAGITEAPKTPDDFLDALQKIKDKYGKDVVPLYTNFAASWTMGAWDAYIDIAATGDPDYKNYVLPHSSNPFSKRDDMTGPYAVYYVLYEAVARGLIEEDPASTDWESSKGKINNGEIATMVLGSWCVEQFKQAGDNPDDIGYMPFPITVNGKQYAAAGGNYSYGINIKSSDDNKLASMIYVKWLLEESPMFEDEGSIPSLLTGDFPDTLSEFSEVELLSNNTAKEGEETLFDDINNESEVGINNNDYPDCAIVEAALYKTQTLEQVMDEWNEKWTNAQKSLEVEIIN